MQKNNNKSRWVGEEDMDQNVEEEDRFNSS